MSEPLLFQLSETLEYSEDGEFQKTATIELSAPSQSCFKEATTLSQLVMRALMESQTYQSVVEKNAEKTDKKEQEIDADAVKFILFASSIEFDDVFKTFKKLAAKVGKITDSLKFNTSLCDKISYEDNIRMVCEYVANFILPSLLPHQEPEEETGV